MAWTSDRRFGDCSMFYTRGYVDAAYKVTERNRKIPLYEKSGPRLQREMPENACYFLDDERVGAHFDLMYYADRSTYQIYNRAHASTSRL